MRVVNSVIHFHILTFMYLINPARAAYFGILMCKFKCCETGTCDHTDYSSEKLSCLVKKGSSRKCEEFQCKQIMCDSKDRPEEGSQSHKQHTKCLCLTSLVLPDQSASTIPESTVTEASQHGVVTKPEQYVLPADVRHIICQPRALDVPMDFDPRSVHQNCSLVDGVLEINTLSHKQDKISQRRGRQNDRSSRRQRPWRSGSTWISRRRMAERNRRGGRRSYDREGHRSRLRLTRIWGANSVQEFISNGTGTQWFGVKISIGKWRWNQSTISALQLFLCRAYFVNMKSNLKKNHWCGGFSFTLSQGLLRIASTCPDVEHEYVEEIRMTDSRVFAVVIRSEQPELAMLDMDGKGIVGKCDLFRMKAIAKLVVQLHASFPISVQFENLKTEDLCW